LFAHPTSGPLFFGDRDFCYNLPMRTERLIIVGLGLMGGSLARGVQSADFPVIGVDSDPATRDAALAAGVVSAAFPALEHAAVQPDDLVVLALPAQAIIATLAHLPRSVPDGCLLLDLGSTKQAICRAMSELPGWFEALGGHPMCGRETSGFASASADLYRNQTFLLTPTVRTTPRLRQRCLDLIALIGARPLIIPPEQHDRLVALVSHLPWALSALLTQQAAETAADNPALWQISASGFRDMSRLSGSGPEMMRDILLTNRVAVRRELARFIAAAQAFDQWLESADADALHSWITQRRSEHAAYREATDP
jgi:prephenate dehydrogenase